MAYLIDSDWLIDYLANLPEAQQLLGRLFDSGIAVSVISYMEVYEGVLRSHDPRDAAEKLESLLQSAGLLEVSASIARRCARLREMLRSQDKRIAPRALDLLIAATTLEYDLALVTRNVDDYADIPELRLYPSGVTD